MRGRFHCRSWNTSSDAYLSRNYKEVYFLRQRAGNHLHLPRYTTHHTELSEWNPSYIRLYVHFPRICPLMQMGNAYSKRQERWYPRLEVDPLFPTVFWLRAERVDNLWCSRCSALVQIVCFCGGNRLRVTRCCTCTALTGFGRKGPWWLGVMIVEAPVWDVCFTSCMIWLSVAK